MFWHGDLVSCWCCQRFAFCVSVVADPTCLQLCPIPHSLYFCWQIWCATLQASTSAEAPTACLALWPAPFQGPGAVRSISCWLSLMQHGCQHHGFVILGIFGVHTISRSMWTSFLGPHQWSLFHEFRESDDENWSSDYDMQLCMHTGLAVSYMMGFDR